MKKIITFLLGISVSMISFGQLQNGAFESWSSIAWDEPLGWGNSNGDAIRSGYSPNVTQSTPGQSGSYAVKMETILNSTDTIFAFMSNSPDPMTGEGGVPYSMQPDSFICFAKTGILTGDTGIILVIFKKSGAPIGMNVFTVAGNNPTVWQRLAFKLGTLAIAPDTVIIAAASSNAMSEMGMQNGSSLILDDLSFTTTQAIPEGGFENWSPVNIEYPDNWMNPNTEWILSGMAPPLVKTSDAYKGDYALQMTTLSGDPGWIFTGMNNGIWDNVNFEYQGGFHYTMQVDTLIGWYKYTPKDTATRAQVNLNLQNGDTTFFNTGAMLAHTATYKQFSIPFNLPLVPDTAIITINSSGWPVTLADTGSVLIIDEVQFKSAPLSTGIQKFSSGDNILLCPNPTTGVFDFLYMPENYSQSNYIVVDMTGKTIKSGHLKNMKTTIDLSGYPQGMYFLRVTDGSKTITKKVIVY